MLGIERVLHRRDVLAVLLAPWLMARHGLEAEPEPAARRANARGAAALQTVASAAPIATEEPVSTAALRVPGADATEIISRLTVPPGARWVTPLPNGSLLLLLEMGTLRVTMIDSQARIARAFDPILQHFVLPEVRPGEEVAVSAGDRLVARGDGAIVALNAGETAAVASVVRVVATRPAT